MKNNYLFYYIFGVWSVWLYSLYLVRTLSQTMHFWWILNFTVLFIILGIKIIHSSSKPTITYYFFFLLTCISNRFPAEVNDEKSAKARFHFVIGNSQNMFMLALFIYYLIYFKNYILIFLTQQIRKKWMRWEISGNFLSN